jgi:hypothetical protein
MREIDYLRELCEQLQQLRDCALAISDGMRRSPGGDAFTYEGGMNAVEMFRDKEADIVSFIFQHGPEEDEDLEEGFDE